MGQATVRFFLAVLDGEKERVGRLVQAGVMLRETSINASGFPVSELSQGPRHNLEHIPG